LANERGVRWSMQHNVPPLMIHASTGVNAMDLESSNDVILGDLTVNLKSFGRVITVTFTGVPPSTADRKYTARLRLQAIGLMITNYSIPGLDGGAVAKRVRERFPAIPILLVSSDADAPSCPSKDAFLAKPFVPSALVDSVRRLLGMEEKQCA
jgi:CheY-like chemotaxis protein